MVTESTPIKRLRGMFFLGLIIKDNIGKFKLPKIDIGKIKFKKHHEKIFDKEQKNQESQK